MIKITGEEIKQPEQTTMIFNNKYDIDIFNPDDLYKINIVISNLFSLGCNSHQLVNDLNDLLTIQTLMIKKHFFLTNNKGEKNEN